MKSILTSLFIIFSVSLFAQFSGYYDPANWTITNTGAGCGPAGTVDVSGAPGSVTLTGPDGSVCSSSVVSYSISSVCGTVCFDWSYSTVDCNGSFYDRFGVSVDGVPTQVSTNCINCGFNQSGSSCFDVTAGGTFSFYINAIDTYCGAASVTISNFSGPDDICHDENNNPKVEICHKGNTICVAPSAVQAHLNHGDYLGPCCAEEGQGLMAVEEDHELIENEHQIAITPRADVIAQLHATLAASNVQTNAIQVYPNPASDVANIQFNRIAGPVNISLYNMNGQVVQQIHAIATHGSSVELNIADLVAGTYEIKVQPENGNSISQKLTVKARN